MLNSSDGSLLLVFCSVARLGSFSSAAIKLKLSKSAVSERIKLLEKRCGHRLLERTTRKVRLTGAGIEVLDSATKIEDNLNLLSQNLDRRGKEPSGELRVSTTHDLGSILVGPAASRLISSYPQVKIEIISGDAKQDMIESQIDIAVRLGAPKVSSFVSRKLALVKEFILASPALVARFKTPSRPSDLESAPWIKHILVSQKTMRFFGSNGETDEMKPNYRVETDSGTTLLSLLLNGAGVGVLPDYMVYNHLLEGKLVRLCPNWIWREVTLYVLAASRASLGPAHRAFLGALRDQMARDRFFWPKK